MQMQTDCLEGQDAQKQCSGPGNLLSGRARAFKRGGEIFPAKCMEIPNVICWVVMSHEATVYLVGLFISVLGPVFCRCFVNSL